MTDQEKITLLNVIALMQLQVFMIDELDQSKASFHRVKHLSSQLKDEILLRQGKNIATLWSISEGDTTNRNLIDFYGKIVEMLARQSVDEVVKQLKSQIE